MDVRDEEECLVNWKWRLLFRTGDVRTVRPVDRETQGGVFVIKVLAVLGFQLSPIVHPTLSTLNFSGHGAATTTSTCQVS